jgi:predicted transposase YbfD/YdcC
LLDKIDVCGSIITADAMCMQKDIVDKIRQKNGDFVIELKANQRSLRYGIEDRLKWHTPVQVFREGPELEHGRIETRIYRTYDGLPLIEDTDKWGGAMTVVEFEAHTVKKSTGAQTCERRLYVSSLSADTPASFLGSVIRRHWSIESMHWSLDCNFKQDRTKRKTTRAARNLDTLQRIVHALFSIWRGKRKKRSDKTTGTAELMRRLSMSFTQLMRFMAQK